MARSQPGASRGCGNHGAGVAPARISAIEPADPDRFRSAVRRGRGRSRRVSEASDGAACTSAGTGGRAGGERWRAGRGTVARPGVKRSPRRTGGCASRRRSRGCRHCRRQLDVAAAARDGGALEPDPEVGLRHIGVEAPGQFWNTVRIRECLTVIPEPDWRVTDSSGGSGFDGSWTFRRSW